MKCQQALGGGCKATKSQAEMSTEESKQNLNSVQTESLWPQVSKETSEEPHIKA